MKRLVVTILLGVLIGLPALYSACSNNDDDSSPGTEDPALHFVGVYRVSSEARRDPEEVTIAINPANPNNLVAGANIFYHYFSMDGGLSWYEGRLESSLGVWGDPVVVFDCSGNAFFGHLSWPSTGSWIDRIVVQKSLDGGLTWSDGTGIGHNPPKQQDKEWLAVDCTDSGFRNVVYIGWTEFDQYGSSDPADLTRIMFSRSEDGGETWVTPLKINDIDGNCIDDDLTVEGVVPAIGPNGEIYICWSGPQGIVLDRSFDGGRTFGDDIFVTDQPGGWAFDVSGISRCNGFPVTACDSGNSPFRGSLYVLWSDQRNGIDDTDVFIASSDDCGLTWNPRVRVNDDGPGRHQFFPWLTIDQSTGFLYVIFYDRRNTTDNDTDVYLARSTDGGKTFTNHPIEGTRFTPKSSIFFGDYTNIAASDGSIHPIWMRLDGNDLSIWTAIFRDY